MQLLYDMLPIIVFFVVFKILGIYYATGAAMLVSLVQVIYFRIKYKRYEKMQLITLIIIMVLGGMTLILHNDIFIKWKPTIINWIFGTVFIVSQVFFKKPVLRYILESKVTLPDPVWSRLNLSWAFFFIIMGAINVYVLYHFSTNVWVNFKLFGYLGLTFIFVIGQGIYLARHVTEDSIKK
jgi:intracellular septation protein